MTTYAPHHFAGLIFRALIRPLLLIFVCSGLTACDPPLNEPRLLLEDIVAGEGPSDLKGRTPTPEREPYEWRTDGELRLADLYRPGEEIRGRLVMVPGLVPLGKDDPRLIALAYSFARMGFAVLAPDMPGFSEYRASPENARDIAEAVLELSAVELGDTPGPQVGIAAISYASGPAVLGAMDPRVAERVSFILSIGGYFDVQEAVTFLITGSYRQDSESPWQQGEPNRKGKWTFLRSNANLIESARDRTVFAAMGARKQTNIDASIADLEQDLGPEGRAIYNLAVNTNPDRVALLIAELPARVRWNFDGLNVATKDLSNLKAPLILIHGVDDPMIPSAESIKMAEHLGDDRAKLYVVSHLFHVEFRGEPTLFDQVKLLFAFRSVLNMRS